MKYLPLVLLIILFILSGCSSQIVADTTPETVTVTSIVEVENTEKIEELERKLKEAEEENQKYDYLLRNLNSLLKNVGYITGSNNSYKNEGTAFTIGYKSKFYLISAGHLVENEYGKFGNFKFKANFSNEWIYPQLLTYKYNRIDSDYSIFYSNKINNGFVTFNTIPNSKEYILGSELMNLNIFKEFNNAIEGESGSPVINTDQEILGICVSRDTLININIILQAIDKLK